MKTMGVAISTTGDDHRMALLGKCVQAWRKALPLGSVIVVTVDGSEADVSRVQQVVGCTVVYRVGQRPKSLTPFSGRQGVAVSKNTGIEFLMDSGVEHLFLCDDDTYPLSAEGPQKHVDLGFAHSMVCWGKHRLVDLTSTEVGGERVAFTEWSWPRGVMLYTSRAAVERVGGLVEAFGPGGHEHVEWSQRIHNAGLTPEPFCSPLLYGMDGPSGDATRAARLWHAEDMRQPWERPWAQSRRKAAHTTVRTTPQDWKKIDAVMAAQEGRDDYVSFRARENGRASATLSTAPSRGAGGEK